MKNLPLLLLSFVLLFAPVQWCAAASHDGGNGKVDIKSVIFGHVKDSYEWHLTTIGDRHVAISLPVIIYSRRTGLEIFSSALFHEQQEYKGFRIASGGVNEGKIVEYDESGNESRPMLDLSITKNAFALMLNSLLLVVIVLLTARWYRRHDARKEVPGGFVGVMEMMIEMIIADVIKPNVGSAYKRYTPYLLTVFFFIFLSNLLGIVPFFPGGANVTGNIAVTMVLALCTFVAVNLFGNKHYWKEILWPDVPVFLKFPLPIMQTIELFGLIAKPFSLMVRLFANIMAGHAMILGLVSVIFVTVKLGAVINGSMTFITMLFGVFMDCLELLVAFIQAYVFTMLSAVFIGMSRQEEH